MAHTRGPCRWVSVRPKGCFKSRRRGRGRLAVAAAPGLELGLGAFEQLREAVKTAVVGPPLFASVALGLFAAGHPTRAPLNRQGRPRLRAHLLVPARPWLALHPRVHATGQVDGPPPLAWPFALTEDRGRGPQAADSARFQQASEFDPVGHGPTPQPLFQHEQGDRALRDLFPLINPQHVLGNGMGGATEPGRFGGTLSSRQEQSEIVLEEAEYRLKHLDNFFVGQRIAAINPARITAYMAKRQEEGAANATINRELETLGKMLKLAYENNKLMRLPIIHKLAANPPRNGFFEPEQYEAVRRLLHTDQQLAVSIAHAFGWRMQSEVLTLQRRQVDLEAGTLRLEPGTTKNDDGRVVYLTPELKALITAQLERVRALERETGQIIPYLFPHLRGPHQGKRVEDFKKAWKTACMKAGCPGMLRHDFRRTAVRNMVNLGVPERVAMKVSGHRSRTVFDRYHIVSPADLQEVARKLTGTVAGTFR
jgi:integrase